MDNLDDNANKSATEARNESTTHKPNRNVEEHTNPTEATTQSRQEPWKTELTQAMGYAYDAHTLSKTGGCGQWHP